MLAGGQSRRMGRDKASLPVGNGTLLSHLVERLAPVVDEVIVAGYRQHDPRLLVRWVPDALVGAGPLAGMMAGLRAIRGSYAWVVGCDLPDVEPALGALLFEAAPGYEAVVPRLGPDPEGVCALYGASLAPRIEELLQSGQLSVISLLERSNVRYLSAEQLRTVDPELRSFRNLNTLQDYEQWLSSRGS